MFNKIILYIFGYLKIQIEGYYLEDFLNCCKANNIKIWNIYRKGSSYLFCYIINKDFKKVMSIALKTKVKVYIIKNYGLISICKKYRKRKIFIALALICVGFIGILSQFVWNIEIENVNGDIDKNELINYLHDKGIDTGVLKKKININELIDTIRLERKDISWIAVEVKGTNLIFKTSKALEKPEIIDKNKTCNIVANKIGIITKLDVRNGTALFKKGDIVKKDDIIVGGWIEGKYTDIRYVHSDADVEAKVWYSKKMDVNLTESKKRYTGDKTTEMGIILGKKQIIFYKGLHKFEKYDKIEENKKLKLFSNFYIPIELKKITYNEFEEFNEELDYNEQKNKIIEKLKNDLNDELNQNSNILNIENEKVNTYEKDGVQEVEVVYEVIENIGRKQKFE